MKKVRRGGVVLSSAPRSKVAQVAAKVGKAIYRDMNPTGKKIVNTIRSLSPATRAGMRKTNVAGKKGNLGVGVGY